MEMPPDLQATWNALYYEVIALHGRWIIYRQLYGTSAARVDLLNDCASNFFYVIQDVLLNDVQMTLSKLADPRETRGKKNLTLETLLAEVSTRHAAAPIAKLREQLEDFQLRCEKVKHRRNKQIAHYDLAAILSSSSIPGPSRQEIEDALGALREFMNTIEAHFVKTTTAYAAFVTLNDGDDLVWIMKQGLRYAELQEAQVIAWDDLNSSTHSQA
jgi:HEPN superfamily AbiU2-like protein